jgi:hypothetical protein
MPRRDNMLRQHAYMLVIIRPRRLGTNMFTPIYGRELQLPPVRRSRRPIGAMVYFGVRMKFRESVNGMIEREKDKKKKKTL